MTLRIVVFLFAACIVGASSPPDNDYDHEIERDKDQQVDKILEQVGELDNPMPVLLLPGFASSRLRAYSSTNCPGNMLKFGLNADVWLDVGMVLAAKWCFLHCMSLNPANQTDPMEPSCRVRPDQGLDAISELNPGTFTGPLSAVWKRLIDMLLEMGFVPDKDLLVAPYDFRLAPLQLEERDRYFTRLKQQIENAVNAREQHFAKVHIRKNHLVSTGVMIIAHSMGNNIFRYFEPWIKYTLGHERGVAWMKRNVNTFIAVGAPILGAQFSLQAAISGLTFGLPITEFDARTMGLGYASYPMVLPSNPARNDTRHIMLNGGNTEYALPVCSVKFPNGTLKEYTANAGVWGLTLWRDLQEFDPWGQWIEKYIAELYKADPVMNPLSEWKRPDIQNVYCAYGVNRKTPVSFRFNYPNNGYENDWDTEATIYEEGHSVYSDDNTYSSEGDPKYTRSGDGTVAYYSLSWCHTWLKETINITRIPQRERYSEEMVFKMQDTTIEEYLKSDIPVQENYNTFFEERSVNRRSVRSTAVWELDNFDHRAVIMEPIFLKQMSHQIHVQNNVIGSMEEQIEDVIEGMVKGISIFPHRGKPFQPSSDEHCHWDYYNVKCAFPKYCGYYYKFGDFHLGMSCRLHSTGDVSLAEVTEAEEALGPCECEGVFCYNGLCKLKDKCEDALALPGFDGLWGRCKLAVNRGALQFLGKDMDNGLEPGSCSADGTCQG